MIALPTLHPAALLRGKSGEGSDLGKFLSTVTGDVAKALEMRRRPPNWEESCIWPRDSAGRLRAIYPTVEDVFRFCDRAQGKLLAPDVETTGNQALDCRLITVGMASASGDAMCVPFLKRGGEPYWAPRDAERVWEAVRWLMADRATPKIFQNGGFDTTVLLAHGMPVPFESWTDDTMAAHHVLEGELPHGLDFLGSVYLEIPSWKQAVKGDKGAKGGEGFLRLHDTVLRVYNLRDCLVTLRLKPILDRKLAQDSLYELYREELEATKEMTRATVRGLYIDWQRRRELSEKLTRERDSAMAGLQRIAKKATFNPASPVQLQQVLFEDLKFPIVKRTPKGNPATDKDAMILLGLHAKTEDQIAFLRELVRWRVPDKQLSTWVGQQARDATGTHLWLGPDLPAWNGGFQILSDGRLHPSWKLLTVTGRFSSSPNAQNWNGAIKKLFRAPPGRKLIGADLSQGELRAMAYAARDPILLEMYENDINVHSVNCTLLFGVRPQPGHKDINDVTLAYLRQWVPKIHGVPFEALPVIGDVQWKSARTLAKNFVFGDNYGAVAETLYNVLRAKRDPDTLEPLFPDLTLGEVEASKIQWEKLHPAIPYWWNTVTYAIQKAGLYRCPLSGRVRRFRGGFERNQMLNFPIQTMIAAHMNKAMIRIARRIELEIGSSAGIICQVHDMLGAEADEADAPHVAEIFSEELCAPVSLPGYAQAFFPCDKPAIHDYLDKV